MLVLRYLLRDALGVDDLLKHVDHVIELAVDIADDDDWLLHAEHVGFIA